MHVHVFGCCLGLAEYVESRRGRDVDGLRDHATDGPGTT
eukprot:COSAG05_NODE_23124_length_260_cov_0.639752_2_plen_38_part_01